MIVILYLIIILLICIILYTLGKKTRKTTTTEKDISFLKKYQNIPEHLRLCLHENPYKTVITIQDNETYYIKYKNEYDPNYKLKGE